MGCDKASYGPHNIGDMKRNTLSNKKFPEILHLRIRSGDFGQNNVVFPIEKYCVFSFAENLVRTSTDISLNALQIQMMYCKIYIT